MTRTDVHRSVVEALGKMIVQGVYAPGERLPVEAELLKDFAVSRTALREAIKVLVGKGLVEVRRSTGSRVCGKADWSWFDKDVLVWRTSSETIDRQLLSELTEVRRIFEPAAAELAAKHATVDQRTELLAKMDAMERCADDATRFAAADMAFHQQLLVCAQNTLLLQMATAVEAALLASRAITLTVAGAAVASLTQHRALVSAILDGRPDDANAAAAALIDRTLDDLNGAFARTTPRRMTDRTAGHSAKSV